jgi:hypothetical protein
MAGDALRLVDLLAGLQRGGLRGVPDFDASDRLQTPGERFVGIGAAACARLVADTDEVGQQEDADDGDQEGRDDSDDQLLGRADRALVVRVGVVLLGVAH